LSYLWFFCFSRFLWALVLPSERIAPQSKWRVRGTPTFSPHPGVSTAPHALTPRRLQKYFLVLQHRDLKSCAVLQLGNRCRFILFHTHLNKFHNTIPHHPRSSFFCKVSTSPQHNLIIPGRLPSFSDPWLVFAYDGVADIYLQQRHWAMGWRTGSVFRDVVLFFDPDGKAEDFFWSVDATHLTGTCWMENNSGQFGAAWGIEWDVRNGALTNRGLRNATGYAMDMIEWLRIFEISRLRETASMGVMPSGGQKTLRAAFICKRETGGEGTGIWEPSALWSHDANVFREFDFVLQNRFAALPEGS
jgi:hypothetical protein